MKRLAFIIASIVILSACFKIDDRKPDILPRIPDQNPNDLLNDPALNETGNILFIGNSLTYTNDLPGLLKDYALTHGKDIGTAVHALPNTSLQDHWDAGRVQQYISSGKFAYVVIQQGPSSQSEGRNILLEYGAKFKSICDEHQARLAFFMVWPARQHYHTFEGVIKNYSDAAWTHQSILCPVGKIWKDYMDSSQDFSYYGGDGFHPSLKGSQIAAEIIYHSLFE